MPTTEAPPLTDAIDRGQNLLTHSRVACAGTCLRKHYFAYELGIRQDRGTPPLRMGGAFHVGLDVLNRGDTVEDDDQSDVDGHGLVERAAEKAIESYGVTPDWCITDEDLTDWCVEAEIVKRLVVGYAWRWQDDLIQCVETEQVFDLPVINPETGAASHLFRRAGKIDKIARLPDGRLAIVEHKTTGKDLSLGSDYWKRLRLDQQISLYMIAAQDLGYPIVTIVYDVIRRPGIRPRKLTKAEQKTLAETHFWYGEPVTDVRVGVPERETIAMYGARLLVDLQTRPDFYFARQEIPRLDADLDEFRLELWQIAKNLRECQRHGRWFRNTNACLQYNSRCEYFDICSNTVDVQNGPPPGFVQLHFVHPELKEPNDAAFSPAASEVQTA